MSINKIEVNQHKPEQMVADNKRRKSILCFLLDSKYSFVLSIILVYLSFAFFGLFEVARFLHFMFIITSGIFEGVYFSVVTQYFMAVVAALIFAVFLTAVFEAVTFLVYRWSTKIIRKKDGGLFTIQMYIGYTDFSKAVRFAFIPRNIVLGIMYLFLLTNPLLISFFTLSLRFIITNVFLVLSFFLLKRKLPADISHLAFERIVKSYVFFLIMEFIFILSPGGFF
ncbi:MAG: hypothetical protein FWB72_03025 [Firmicutes bacterium]|nr:hypothetical protein [Bacillota bacterium]